MTAISHIDPFWSEADGARVADVPDLQSSWAFGNIPVEALAEVGLAMEAWLEVAREAKPRYRGAKRAAG